MINKLEKVNTGRQKELGDSKGFLLIGILLIHSFQVLGTLEANQTAFYRILFGSFMVTGACLYLFTMGFGTVIPKIIAQQILEKPDSN